jgi:hypothetical protein
MSTRQLPSGSAWLWLLTAVLAVALSGCSDREPVCVTYDGSYVPQGAVPSEAQGVADLPECEPT